MGRGYILAHQSLLVRQRVACVLADQGLRKELRGMQHTKTVRAHLQWLEGSQAWAGCVGSYNNNNVPTPFKITNNMIW